jgi:hypothetical protein
VLLRLVRCTLFATAVRAVSFAITCDRRADGQILDLLLQPTNPVSIRVSNVARLTSAGKFRIWRKGTPPKLRQVLHESCWSHATDIFDGNISERNQ